VFASSFWLDMHQSATEDFICTVFIGSSLILLKTECVASIMS